MSNKINIDELLKQELGNMTPEPPAGIWESVSNQVQLAQPAVQAVNSAASVTKTTLVGSKIIVTTVVAVMTTVAGFVGYKLYTGNNEEPGTEQSQPVIAEASKELQPVVVESNKEESTPGDIKSEELSKQPKTARKHTGLAKTDQPVRYAKEIVQPAFTDQPDKAMDPTDPLVVPEQQARIQNETIIPKQNAGQEEQPSQLLNSEEEEQAAPFEPPFIPNVFTPNVDGKNDEFEIALDNEIVYDLKITDRKGNIVFESRDKNFRWQGVNIYTGKICEEGMYVYAFKYQLKGMKNTETKSGWINLRLSQRQ